MLPLKVHIISLITLFPFCSTVLYAQLSRQDSIAIDSLLKSNKPLILNQEVIRNIRFDKQFVEQAPERLLDISSLFAPDFSLPNVLVDKDGKLTLRPYTIYIKPYEDPIQGLPPPIMIEFELPPVPARTLSFGIGFAYTFDAEGILRRIFWKSERAKRRNAKRVQAHRYY